MKSDFTGLCLCLPSEAVFNDASPQQEHLQPRVCVHAPVCVWGASILMCLCSTPEIYTSLRSGNFSLLLSEDERVKSREDAEWH